MKKGDKVRILDSERRPRYEQITNKIGEIVRISTYIDPYNHVENTNYYVEIPEFINEYQGNGWWVFKDVNSLRTISDEVTCDDKMDAYEYAIQKLGLSNNPHNRDYIIKGDKNNMTNILEIYEDRRRVKINKKYDELENSIKLTDARYKVWKECVDTLDKLYAEDKIVGFAHLNIELSEDTYKKLHTLYEAREKEFRKLLTTRHEVDAQMEMCETYDQKQEILRRYNIINKNGKINA